MSIDGIGRFILDGEGNANTVPPLFNLNNLQVLAVDCQKVLINSCGKWRCCQIFSGNSEIMLRINNWLPVAVLHAVLAAKTC